MDTIHAEETYEYDKEQINEYLSCISLSDDAIKKLIEYFKKSDRKVVICMVGDHAPSFIGEITARSGFSEEQKEIMVRSVPFFIWANYPIEEKNIGYTSLINLIPMTLKTAEIPLSPYYKYINNMEKDIPVITKYGRYLNTKGQIKEYMPENAEYDELHLYFEMEYNNIADKSRRMQNLFEKTINN